jgi:hypothetical protein
VKLVKAKTAASCTTEASDGSYFALLVSEAAKNSTVASQHGRLGLQMKQPARLSDSLFSPWQCEVKISPFAL